jgi:hypothetical protein
MTKPKAQKLTRGEARQLRAIRQKRGQGKRETYSPWIQLRRGDLASRGQSSYTPSAIFNRHHVLLSALERTALHCLQLLNPLDIREQFPLALHGVEEEFFESCQLAQGTTEIADGKTIKHPMFRAGDPIVMSTDFVVTRRDSIGLAVHVKYEKDLLDRRGTELRQIEMEYWRQRRFEFCVFTEKDIGSKARDNLILLQSYDRRNRPQVDPYLLREIVELGSYLPMKVALQKISARCRWQYEDLVDLLKFSASTGRVILDLSTFSLSWSQVWPPMRIHASVDMDAPLLLEMEEDFL